MILSQIIQKDSLVLLLSFGCVSIQSGQVLKNNQQVLFCQVKYSRANSFLILWSYGHSGWQSPLWICLRNRSGLNKKRHKVHLLQMYPFTDEKSEFHRESLNHTAWLPASEGQPSPPLQGCSHWEAASHQSVADNQSMWHNPFHRYTGKTPTFPRK